MRCFGAVVEAVGAAAGLAAEGEEVELAAEGHLAVSPHGIEISAVFFVQHCVGGTVWWGRRWSRSRHSGGQFGVAVIL